VSALTNLNVVELQLVVVLIGGFLTKVLFMKRLSYVPALSEVAIIVLAEESCLPQLARE